MELSTFSVIQPSRQAHEDAALCKRALLTILSVNKLGCRTVEEAVAHDQAVSDLAYAAYVRDHIRVQEIIERLEAPQDLSHLYRPLAEDDLEHYGVRTGSNGYED